jgi:hypothetical protein
MEATESTTKWGRTFVDVALYLRILQAKENQERPIYKIAKFISRTAYPNGVVKHYLI